MWFLLSSDSGPDGLLVLMFAKKLLLCWVHLLLSMLAPS